MLRSLPSSILAVAVLAAFAAAAEPQNPPAVYRARVEPHWIDGERFWYRNELPSGDREYIYVNAADGERLPAFDAGRLVEALMQATGESHDAAKLDIRIVNRDASSVTIVDGGAGWRCDLESYELERVEVEIPTEDQKRPSEQIEGRRLARSEEEPDGDPGAEIRDGNLFLVAMGDEAKQLSHDGSEDRPYTRFFWSPDRRAIVAFRLRRGDHREVYRLESSPIGPDGNRGGGAGRAIMHSREYTLPGDRLDSYELNLFDVESGRQIKPSVEEIDMADYGDHPRPRIRWCSDGKRFTYEKYDRGHQRVRLIEVDAATGDCRTLLDEQSETFIWSAHTEQLQLRLFNYLDDESQAIYVSERSGWRHLYLLDLESGALNPITSGDWVIRGINRIDEDTRQIWFSASGVYPDQDPYFVHFGRVNFNGGELTWLTEANGHHRIDFTAGSESFSPSQEYFLVTYSRVDLPPVTELRRVQDGKLVLELERGEVIGDWEPLEVFTAKGRDGKTDIWGVIRRPADFDPSKKYPIIEDVYAGPHGAHVPKTFSLRTRYDGLARLGFVVVQADGMGTAMRSKKFHDVCWQNLGDAGIPDRIAWIKAAAAERPWMDLERVGIYGTSAGGQAAAGALLFHSDFYKAAVANCGCHDNRLDKISWNEQWMGYPVGPQYSASSNVDNAAKLQGHLQLVLGEMDDNVPVESTYRFVDALIRAEKDFEFVLVPGAGHGAGGTPFTRRKLENFFIRHLRDAEPAER